MKQLKLEVAVLERKIQLTLTSIEKHDEQRVAVDENTTNAIPQTFNHISLVNPMISNDKKVTKGLKL